MARTILIVLGHPQSDSFCAALAEAYAEGARRAGATVEILRLADLDFDPNADPRLVPQLEDDLLRAQQLIRDTHHIAWVYPLWWGSGPALLKAFIDRTFIAGFAMRYQEGKPMPERLLTGRSARILITMDSPSFWHALVYRRSGTTWLRWATLWFSGFQVRKTQEFTRIRESTPESRAQLLSRARTLGEKDGQK